jgi:hypothetical protein
MKKLIVFIVAFLLLLSSSAVMAKNFEVKKKAGEYTVQIATDKAPSVGKIGLQIGIKDAKGADVTDASVLVEYGMPAMTGMPAMNYKADAELKGKLYVAVMDISMAGPWTINIKITRAGKTQSVKLTMDAR